MSSVKFHEIQVGSKFKHDGELFVKTSNGDNFDPPNPNGGLSWSIKDNQKYKEWVFTGDELCEVKS